MIRRPGFPVIAFAADGNGAGSTTDVSTSSTSASSGSSTGSTNSASAPSTPSGAPSAAPSTPTTPSSPTAAPPREGAAVSSPTPAPVPPPTQPGAPVPGSSDLGLPDFATIFGDADPTEAPLPLDPGPAVPAQPAPPTPAVATPAPAPDPKVPAPATAQPAPESPTPVVAPGPKDQRPPLDPYDPVALANALQEHEQAAVAELANTTFKLSQEDVEALETDTVGTIPKLLARAHVKAQHAILTQMGRLIPVLIQRQTAAIQRNEQSLDKFFARWPDLDKLQHRDVVMKHASEFRRLHPTATFDEMQETLGPIVMMAAKVTPKAQSAAPKVNGASPPQQQPFVPAPPGTPVATPSVVESQSWDILDPSKQAGD